MNRDTLNSPETSPDNREIITILREKIYAIWEAEDESSVKKQVADLEEIISEKLKEGNLSRKDVFELASFTNIGHGQHGFIGFDFYGDVDSIIDITDQYGYKFCMEIKKMMEEEGQDLGCRDRQANVIQKALNKNWFQKSEIYKILNPFIRKFQSEDRFYEFLVFDRKVAWVLCESKVIKSKQLTSSE